MHSSQPAQHRNAEQLSSQAYAASRYSKRRTSGTRHAGEAVGRPTCAALPAHALPMQDTHSLSCCIPQVGRSALASPVCLIESLLLDRLIYSECTVTSYYLPLPNEALAQQVLHEQVTQEHPA